MSENNKRKINVLQAWRAIFIGMIFIEHTAIKKPLGYLAGGGEGVSFFIILSGFLTGYIYIEKINDFSFTAKKNFLMKKIKKFYPLHIIALVLALLLNIAVLVKNSGIDIKQIGEICCKAILNALFLQVYVPVSSWYMNNINGVTWFLSTIVFCYAMSIGAIRVIKKIKNNRKLFLLVLSVWLLHTAFVLCFKDTSLKTFILYVFPPFRFLEYFVAMILGYWVRNNIIKIENYSMASWMEIGVVLLFILQHSLKVSGCFPAFLEYIYISMFIVSSLIVVVFSQQKGCFSKLLDNKYLVYIGNISFEIYIMHQVIIKYVTTVLGWNYLSTIVSLVLVLTFAIMMDKYKK